MFPFPLGNDDGEDKGTAVLATFEKSIASSAATLVTQYVHKLGKNEAQVLNTKEHVRWVLQCTGHTFSFPCEKMETLVLSLDIYKRWMFEKARPAALEEEEDEFLCSMFSHMSQLFTTRQYHSSSLFDRHVEAAHTALDMFAQVARILAPRMSKATWRVLLRVLITIGQELLPGAVDRDSLGNAVEHRYLRVLFDAWLRSYTVDDSLWNLFATCCRSWLHRRWFSHYWFTACKALSKQVVRCMYAGEEKSPSEGKEPVTIRWRDSYVSYFSSEGLTQIVYSWHQMMSLIGKPSQINDPDTYFHTCAAIAELVDLFLCVPPKKYPNYNPASPTSSSSSSSFSGPGSSPTNASKQEDGAPSSPDAATSDDKTEEGRDDEKDENDKTAGNSGGKKDETGEVQYIPPLASSVMKVFHPWLFDIALHDCKGFHKGQAAGVGCLVRVLIHSEREVDFPEGLKAQIIRTLAHVCKFTDTSSPVISSLILQGKRLFASSVAGVRILIPSLLPHLRAVVSSSATEKNVRSAAICMLSSIVCVGFHYDANISTTTPTTDIEGDKSMLQMLEKLNEIPTILLNALVSETEDRNLHAILCCVHIHLYGVLLNRQDIAMPSAPNPPRTSSRHKRSPTPKDGDLRVSGRPASGDGSMVERLTNGASKVISSVVNAAYGVKGGAPNSTATTTTTTTTNPASSDEDGSLSPLSPLSPRSTAFETKAVTPDAGYFSQIVISTIWKSLSHGSWSLKVTVSALRTLASIASLCGQHMSAGDVKSTMAFLLDLCKFVHFHLSRLTQKQKQYADLKVMTQKAEWDIQRTINLIAASLWCLLEWVTKAKRVVLLGGSAGRRVCVECIRSCTTALRNPHPDADMKQAAESLLWHLLSGFNASTPPDAPALLMSVQRSEREIGYVLRGLGYKLGDDKPTYYMLGQHTLLSCLSVMPRTKDISSNPIVFVVRNSAGKFLWHGIVPREPVLESKKKADVMRGSSTIAEVCAPVEEFDIFHSVLNLLGMKEGFDMDASFSSESLSQALSAARGSLVLGGALDDNEEKESVDGSSVSGSGTRTSSVSSRARASSINTLSTGDKWTLKQAIHSHGRAAILRGIQKQEEELTNKSKSYSSSFAQRMEEIRSKHANVISNTKEIRKTVGNPTGLFLSSLNLATPSAMVHRLSSSPPLTTDGLGRAGLNDLIPLSSTAEVQALIEKLDGIEHSRAIHAAVLYRCDEHVDWRDCLDVDKETYRADKSFVYFLYGLRNTNHTVGHALLSIAREDSRIKPSYTVASDIEGDRAHRIRALDKFPIRIVWSRSRHPLVFDSSSSDEPAIFIVVSPQSEGMFSIRLHVVEPRDSNPIPTVTRDKKTPKFSVDTMTVGRRGSHHVIDGSVSSSSLSSSSSSLSSTMPPGGLSSSSVSSGDPQRGKTLPHSSSALRSQSAMANPFSAAERAQNHSTRKTALLAHAVQSGGPLVDGTVASTLLLPVLIGDTVTNVAKVLVSAKHSESTPVARRMDLLSNLHSLATSQQYEVKGDEGDGDSDDDERISRALIQLVTPLHVSCPPVIIPEDNDEEEVETKQSV